MEDYRTGKRLAKYVPDYVMFDLETTGTSYISDSIIEISAVKVVQAQVTDTFSTLVNPQRAIPYHATQIHGITDEMVADAPLLADALPDFLEFAGDFTWVGHNVMFDYSFVKQWEANHRIKRICYGVDTLKIVSGFLRS